MNAGANVLNYPNIQPAVSLVFNRATHNLPIQSITPMIKLVEKHVTEHAVRCDQEDDVRDVADAIALAAKQTPDDIKQQLNMTDNEIR